MIADALKRYWHRKGEMIMLDGMSSRDERLMFSPGTQLQRKARVEEEDC